MILQFSMLLISESAYEIQTLLRMGYHPRKLASLFFSYFLKLFIILIGISIPLFLLIKMSVDASMIQYGFMVSSWPSIFGIVLIFVLGMGITYWNYRAVFRKMTQG